MWIPLSVLLAGLILSVVCCRALSGESILNGFRNYIEALKLLSGILAILLALCLYLYERFDAVTLWVCVGCVIGLFMVGAFAVTLMVRYSRLSRPKK